MKHTYLLSGIIALAACKPQPTELPEVEPTVFIEEIPDSTYRARQEYSIEERLECFGPVFNQRSYSSYGDEQSFLAGIFREHEKYGFKMYGNLTPIHLQETQEWRYMHLNFYQDEPDVIGEVIFDYIDYSKGEWMHEGIALSPLPQDERMYREAEKLFGQFIENMTYFESGLCKRKEEDTVLPPEINDQIALIGQLIQSR